MCLNYHLLFLMNIAISQFQIDDYGNILQSSAPSLSTSTTSTNSRLLTSFTPLQATTREGVPGTSGVPRQQLRVVGLRPPVLAPTTTLAPDTLTTAPATHTQATNPTPTPFTCTPAAYTLTSAPSTRTPAPMPTTQLPLSTRAPPPPDPRPGPVQARSQPLQAARREVPEPRFSSQPIVSEAGTSQAAGPLGSWADRYFERRLGYLDQIMLIKIR